MNPEEMTNEDIDAEIDRLSAIREARRYQEELVRNKERLVGEIDALLIELQQLEGVQAGDEWVAPVSATGAYPLGAVVRSEGYVWENVTPSNPHRPGVSGWARVPEVDPETGREIPPPFVQPAGAHDAYKKGQRITWTDGKIYSAVRSGVVHTPADAPSEWELFMEPDPEPTEPPADPGETPAEPDEVEPWAQPQGAHDAYQFASLVSYEGQVWVSTANNNVWAPGVYGWSLYDA